MKRFTVSVLIAGISIFSMADVAQARTKRACTKRYSKYALGAGWAARGGVAYGWGLKAAFWGAAGKVITAWSVGTGIGQGVNYAISTRWDPDPIYWCGSSGPIFSPMTDAQADALIPGLMQDFEFTDPNFGAITAETIRDDVNACFPGLGDDTISYLRSSVKSYVGLVEGAAAYWENRPDETVAALATVVGEIDNMRTSLTAAAPKIASAMVQKTDDTWIHLEAMPGQEGVLPYITQSEVEDWISDVAVNGASALPLGEVAAHERLETFAQVCHPENLGDHMSQWVAEGGLHQEEADTFVPYGGSQSTSQMFESSEICWDCLIAELYATPLPEPTTAATLGFSALWLVPRRRRKEG